MNDNMAWWLGLAIFLAVVILGTGITYGIIRFNDQQHDLHRRRIETCRQAQPLLVASCIQNS